MSDKGSTPAFAVAYSASARSSIALEYHAKVSEHNVLIWLDEILMFILTHEFKHSGSSSNK